MRHLLHPPISLPWLLADTLTLLITLMMAILVKPQPVCTESQRHYLLLAASPEVALNQLAARFALIGQASLKRVWQKEAHP